MNIQQVNQEEGGKFFAEKDNRQLALMIYRWAPNGNMIIEHTEVDPSLKGQGVGFELVSAAVKQARAQQFKIQAECPYAAAVLKKTTAFHDVLDS